MDLRGIWSTRSDCRAKRVGQKQVDCIYRIDL